MSEPTETAPADGAAVVLSRCPGLGEACAQELRAVLGGDAEVLLVEPVPGADPAAVAEQVAAVAPGPVRVLVTISEHPVPGRAATAARDAATQVADELVTVQAVVDRLLPGMVDAGYGRVVLVVEATGTRGAEHWGDGRGPAMWGLVGLARSAAREVAAAGVTVNVVRTGVVATDAVEAARGDDPALGEALDRLVAGTPTRKLTTPDDVAAAVGFLASPEASYVTGVVLPVDGGLTMGFGA